MGTRSSLFFYATGCARARGGGATYDADYDDAVSVSDSAPVISLSRVRDFE